MVDFAAAVLPSETTCASPFLIDCGYEPRTSFDWHPIDNTLPQDRRISRENAKGMVKRMEDIWKTVQQNIEGSQEIQKNSADKHRREPDFRLQDLRFLKSLRLIECSPWSFEAMMIDNNFPSSLVGLSTCRMPCLLGNGLVTAVNCYNNRESIYCNVPWHTGITYHCVVAHMLQRCVLELGRFPSSCLCVKFVASAGP